MVAVGLHRGGGAPVLPAGQATAQRVSLRVLLLLLHYAPDQVASRSTKAVLFDPCVIQSGTWNKDHTAQPRSRRPQAASANISAAALYTCTLGVMLSFQLHPVVPYPGRLCFGQSGGCVNGAQQLAATSVVFVQGCLLAMRC